MKNIDKLRLGLASILVLGFCSAVAQEAQDDVAVAHYLYSSAYKPKSGDIEMNNGRYTDVLVRTEDGLKFIAWHGGDD